MISIRKILDKVLPKLEAIEENPTVDVIRISSTQPHPTNPFDTANIPRYDETVTVPCVYSEQPEIISKNNNITTEQVTYLYIKQKVLEEVNYKDRFIFKNIRYRPVEIQNLFGVWKIKIVKE